MDLVRSILDTALRVVAFASIPCVIAAAVVQVRMLGRERPLARRDLSISIALSLAFLVLYTQFLQVTPVYLLSWPLLIGGLILGGLIGRMMAIGWGTQGPTVASGWWSVVVWAAAFSFTQALVLFAGSEAVALGLSAVFFSTGLSVGQDGILLARTTRLGRRALHTAEEAPSLVCRGCGVALNVDARFCIRCGRQVA